MKILTNLKSIVSSYLSGARVNKEYEERKKLATTYLAPDPVTPEINLPVPYNNLSKELQKNGIIKIEGFEAIADYVNTTYMEPAENNTEIPKWHQLTLSEKGANTGRSVQMSISFDDSKLKDLFFSSDLLGIVYNYYQRQPYFRNLPALTKVEYKKDQEISIQGKFHLDGGLKQVSYMLLLNDIDEEDTHMEYALGTPTIKNPLKTSTVLPGMILLLKKNILSIIL